MFFSKCSVIMKLFVVSWKNLLLPSWLETHFRLHFSFFSTPHSRHEAGKKNVLRELNKYFQFLWRWIWIWYFLTRNHFELRREKFSLPKWKQIFRLFVVLHECNKVLLESLSNESHSEARDWKYFKVSNMIERDFFNYVFCSFWKNFHREILRFKSLTFTELQSQTIL